MTSMLTAYFLLLTAYCSLLTAHYSLLAPLAETHFFRYYVRPDAAHCSFEARSMRNDDHGNEETGAEAPPAVA